MSLLPRTRRVRVAALAGVGLLVLAGSATGTAAAPSTDQPDHGLHLLRPVPTTEADWQPVADALGRTGTLQAGTVYGSAPPRRDLAVTSYGVAIKPGFALGSYAVFTRSATAAPW